MPKQWPIGTIKGLHISQIKQCKISGNGKIKDSAQSLLTYNPSLLLCDACALCNLLSFLHPPLASLRDGNILLACVLQQLLLLTFLLRAGIQTLAMSTNEIANITLPLLSQYFMWNRYSNLSNCSSEKSSKVSRGSKIVWNSNNQTKSASGFNFLPTISAVYYEGVWRQMLFPAGILQGMLDYY